MRPCAVTVAGVTAFGYGVENEQEALPGEEPKPIVPEGVRENCALPELSVCAAFGEALIVTLPEEVHDDTI